MTKLLAIGAALLAVAAGVLGWLLLEAHEQLGKAELKAEINARTVEVLQAQDTRNQVIDQKLERLSGARDTEIRETIREIYIQPSSDACRKSAAMRALDGRLRYQPGHPDGRSPAAATPAQPVPASGR